jgi:hypothetical protein
VVAIKLQEPLLAREGELDSKDGATVVREDGLVAFECTLGRACMEYDTPSVPELTLSDRTIWPR